MSLISKLVSLLVKIRFIPVNNDRKKDRITFKLCSFVTLTFFIIHFGLFLMINLTIQLAAQTVSHVFMEYWKKTNIIDTISSLLLGPFVSWLFPFCPVFLAKGLPFIPTISLANDLKWPRHGAKHVLSYFLCALGLLAINGTFWSDILKEENTETHIQVLIYISSSFQYLIAPLYLILPTMLVSSWMEKFVSLCEYENDGKEVPRARRCIELYLAFQKGFGTFFLYVFSVTQLLSVFTLFLTVSHSIGSAYTLSTTILYSFGNLLITSGLILNIAGLTFTLEIGHKSLLDLAKPLQEQLIPQMDGCERQVIKNIIQNLSQMQPLTGNGFFAITRSTLTAMTSVSITYIIILVQFKMSAT